MWSKFEYLKPSALSEAFDLLSRYGEDAKILAGGTDVFVNMKNRTIRPRYVVDIKGLSGLDQIKSENGQLKIGGLVTVNALRESKIIQEKAEILMEATEKMGSVQTRNRATVGGNICNAAPGADITIPLLAMDATVNIASSSGVKTVALEEFFTGPGKTILKPGEIVTEIIVPEKPPHTGRVFFKHQHRDAMALAILNVAISLTLLDNGACKDVKIILGAVAPTPIRAKQAENALMNQQVNDQTIQKAADIASTEITPRRGSIRATPEYRVELTKVMVRRTLKRAAEKAREV